MKPAKVLVVDDDIQVRDFLRDVLEGISCTVECAGALREGTAKASAMDFDVVFLDVGLPDGSGLDAIETFRKSLGHPEVVIMTGKGDPSGAALALRHGSWNYLSKPFNVDDVRLAVAQVMEYRRSSGWLSRSTLQLRDFVATSEAMAECLHVAARAAASDVPVLIVGETGTGKERLARGIHEHSARASKPFVVVDCTVIPEALMESHLFGHEKGAFTGADRQRTGLVALAHGGTLFLDEVGDLPQAAQAKLLRLVQEKTFRPVGSKEEKHADFRLMAATHRDLEGMVKEGRFREDLFYRLAGLILQVPPLRRRKEDIVPIVQDILRRHAESLDGELKGLSPDFVETILHYPWPGNVRELIHAVLHALTMGSESATLYAVHLPHPVRTQVAVKNLDRLPTDPPDKEKAPSLMPCAAPPSFFEAPKEGAWPTYKAYREQAAAQATRIYLNALMKRCRGNVAEACTLSGLSRSRLYALMKEAGLGDGASRDMADPGPS